MGRRCERVRTMRARIVMAILAALGAATVAPAADAATVGIRDGALVYRAAPGESNNLFLRIAGSEYTVEDGNRDPDPVSVTAGAPCRPAAPPPDAMDIDAF